MQPTTYEPGLRATRRAAPKSHVATRRVLLALAILLAMIFAAAGAYYGWKQLDFGAGRSEAALLVLYGNVEIRQVDLAFGVEGPVERVLVDEGDHVKKDQVLAVLEQDAFIHAEASADAMLQQAEAMLAELLAGSRPQEIERARATAAANEAALENAEISLRRAEELARREYTAQAVLDAAKMTARTAAALLRQSRADLALRLEGPRSEEIVRQRAEVAARRATLALQRYRLARSTLKAPYDGVILTRVREAGAVVGANSPVFTLSVLEPVWIRTYVDEPNLGRVAPGDSVEITTDSMPGQTYRGQIGYVSPSSEFTPRAVETPDLRTALVYRVRIIVQNPDRALRQGMPVTIRVPVAKAEARK